MAARWKRATKKIPLSELGAIAECLAAIGVDESVAKLIEKELRRPSQKELEEHFTQWCRAPRDGEPPDRFVMGSPFGEEERKKQVPVSFSAPFSVLPTSVTYGMWCLMAEKNDHAERWGDGDRLPVTFVTWFEASLHARWLDHWLRKLVPGLIPAGHRVALPTEAQREYFTRAGTATRFWSGDEERHLVEVGWFNLNSEGRLHAVGEKPANGWGIRDVHGNVWEWCRDWFHEELRGGRNPLGPDSGRDRVLRGGSCGNVAWNCRSADRRSDSPDSAWYFRGFRLVLSAPERASKFDP